MRAGEKDLVHRDGGVALGSGGGLDLVAVSKRLECFALGLARKAPHAAWSCRLQARSCVIVMDSPTVDVAPPGAHRSKPTLRPSQSIESVRLQGPQPRRFEAEHGAEVKATKSGVTITLCSSEQLLENEDRSRRAWGPVRGASARRARCGQPPAREVASAVSSPPPPHRATSIVLQHV